MENPSRGAPEACLAPSHPLVTFHCCGAGVTSAWVTEHGKPLNYFMKERGKSRQQTALDSSVTPMDFSASGIRPGDVTHLCQQARVGRIFPHFIFQQPLPEVPAANFNSLLPVQYPANSSQRTGPACDAVTSGSWVPSPPGLRDRALGCACHTHTESLWSSRAPGLPLCSEGN